jgi:branched-chain amino acid transport system substrate-binding protein
MMKARRVTVRAVALISVGALVLTACSSSKKSTSTTATTASASSGGSGGATAVKIGFIGALTGADAQLGINIENGQKLAMAQYTSTNPKVSVTIDPFDTQGAPAQAPAAANKMISDKVVAIIGPAFSGESAAADPILETGKIPSISASATNVKLAQNGWKYFHRALADDSAQGPGDAAYLYKTLGSKTVAIIDDSSTYGEPLAGYVSTEFKSLGGTVAVSDHIDPNGQDYSATVNKIIAAKPQAVFFGGYYDAAGRLVKQLKADGYSGVFMSGDGSEDPHIITDAGGAPAEGVYLSCACEDTTSSANAASFNSAYQTMFGVAPAIYSAEAYDATNFILAAIKAGNSTTSSINAYLASNSFVGITKTLKFQSDGNITGGTIFMYQVKGGKIVQIGTTPAT